jgi:hypothetical protein
VLSGSKIQFLECKVSFKIMRLKTNEADLISRSVKTEEAKHVASISRVFHGFVVVMVILL